MILGIVTTGQEQVTALDFTRAKKILDCVRCQVIDTNQWSLGSVHYLLYTPPLAFL